MKDTGGPAYPSNEYAEGSFNCGMTVRDYFAGQALIGIISHPQGHGGRWELAAQDAYICADAMIKERNK